MAKTVRLDSTNHDAAWGDETTYYAGYFLVNDEKFNDDGNTDRDDPQYLNAAARVLQILGITEDLDLDEGLTLCEEINEVIALDLKKGVVEITGTSWDDLEVIQVQ